MSCTDIQRGSVMRRTISSDACCGTAYQVMTRTQVCIYTLLEEYNKKPKTQFEMCTNQTRTVSLRDGVARKTVAVQCVACAGVRCSAHCARKKNGDRARRTTAGANGRAAFTEKKNVRARGERWRFLRSRVSRVRFGAWAKRVWARNRCRRRRRSFVRFGGCRGVSGGG